MVHIDMIVSYANYHGDGTLYPHVVHENRGSCRRAILDPIENAVKVGEGEVVESGVRALDKAKTVQEAYACSDHLGRVQLLTVLPAVCLAESFARGHRMRLGLPHQGAWYAAT